MICTVLPDTVLKDYKNLVLGETLTVITILRERFSFLYLFYKVTWFIIKRSTSTLLSFKNQNKVKY